MPLGEEAKALPDRGCGIHTVSPRLEHLGGDLADTLVVVDDEKVDPFGVLHGMVGQKFEDAIIPGKAGANGQTRPRGV